MNRPVLLVLLATVGWCSAVTAAEASDWYVDAATGADANSGSEPERAWRTLGAAVAAINEGVVRAGDSVFFEAGTYGAVAPAYEVIRADGEPGSPISLVGCPGARKPAVLGWLVLKGDHLTASGFTFDGPTGGYPASDGSLSEQPLLEIEGDHVTIADSEVRESWSGGGVLVGTAGDPALDFAISRSWIHDNGRFSDPEAANFHHGLYVQNGWGTVAGNLIADNYGYGVHLYPSPSGVSVRDNLIVGHGRAGVIVAGENGAPLPARNLIANNLLVDNNRAVTALEPLGSANAAVANVSWNNSQPAFFDPGGALIEAGNEDRDPRLLLPERARLPNERTGPFAGSLALAAFERGCG